MDALLSIITELIILYHGIIIGLVTPMSIVLCCLIPQLSIILELLMYSTQGKFDVIRVVHGFAICSSHIAGICITGIENKNAFVCS